MRRFVSMARALAVACALLSGSAGAASTLSAGAPPLRLSAETSDFQETGPMAEVEAFASTLQRRYPKAVRAFVLGETAEGRSIPALVINGAGVLSPALARQKGLPVVWVIAGAHAGEIDGKDAGLSLIRDALAAAPAPAWLKQVVVVFVPVFNVDGHEHRAAFNRPNQEGPRLTGERLTAERINLNRDWMLAQSPEMQAMLKGIQRWDPLVTVDLHVLDGFKYRHPVSITSYPFWGMSPSLQAASESFHAAVVDRVRSAGYAPLPFYPELVDKEDPAAGVVYDPDAPRFSHVYAVLRQRLGVLVENYAWNDYRTRVQVARATLQGILDTTAAQRLSLQAEVRQADDVAAAGQHSPLVLDWRNSIDLGVSETDQRIELQGVAYTLYEDAPVVGGRQIRFWPEQPMRWDIPFFRRLEAVPESTLRLPGAGYLIPAAWANRVLPHLQRHGIRWRWLDGLAVGAGQAFQGLERFVVDVERLNFEPSPFQGRQRTSGAGAWQTTDVTTLPSARRYVWVPSAQPRALLAAHLLEPVGPDSLFAWGAFNTAFEASDAVAGHREFELARWMYEEDPRLAKLLGDAWASQLPTWRAEFTARLAQDADFRDDPKLRLGFWMSRLPNPDVGFQQYPILRVH